MLLYVHVPASFPYTVQYVTESWGGAWE